MFAYRIIFFYVYTKTEEKKVKKRRKTKRKEKKIFVVPGFEFVLIDHSFIFFICVNNFFFAHFSCSVHPCLATNMQMYKKREELLLHLFYKIKIVLFVYFFLINMRYKRMST